MKNCKDLIFYYHLLPRFSDFWKVLKHSANGINQLINWYCMEKFSDKLFCRFFQFLLSTEYFYN